jgi:hypothetical protein
MAMIKSALELALEKTKDLAVDEAAIAARELRQEGKRAAGQFLDDPASGGLGERLEAFPKDKRSFVREGMFEVLASQLQLPTNEASMAKLELLGKAFASLGSPGGLKGMALGGEKRVQALFQQLTGFFRQYLDDMKNVEQVIRKQWGPKLREKEREMSARMGQDVRLDPMADPEFAAFYKQNVGAVRQQYQAALEKAKSDLAAMVGAGAAGGA